MTTTTATKTTRSGLLGGRSPLLRLQSDERLIVLMRSGNDAAFEVLFGRYRTRLLGFCRHMLGSKEDAEDVLQEVFANAYNAILADQREINVRPWLYRIARNRCLNHLRRPTADASDTMDEHMDAHGRTAADVVHRRADVRHLLEDVQKLAESQRTALLLREIDALSYDQIAEAMETTIPSVKSLLVRARMSLAEAAEARQLSCDDVRRELAEVAEGLKKASPAAAPPRARVRRMPRVPHPAAQDHDGDGARLPDRPAADPEEARARQARRRRARRAAAAERPPAAPRRRYRRGRGRGHRRGHRGHGRGDRRGGHRCGRRSGRRPRQRRRRRHRAQSPPRPWPAWP